MNLEKDSYKTIDVAVEAILFKEKKSKFYGYAFPMEEENQLPPVIAKLQKKYPKAVHFCYAYQLGVVTKRFRINDDGEPNNTAGMPIYGQIQSFELTNIAVVIVREFGRTKLGVGGLISAYKTTAQNTLNSCTIITKQCTTNYQLQFAYSFLSKVLKITKNTKAKIISKTLETNGILNETLVQLDISINNSETAKLYNEIAKYYQIAIKKEEYNY